jgi:hypothetical protein
LYSTSFLFKIEKAYVGVTSVRTVRATWVTVRIYFVLTHVPTTHVMRASSGGVGREARDYVLLGLLAVSLSEFGTYALRLRVFGLGTTDTTRK